MNDSKRKAPLKLGVLISGGGTNLQRIIDEIEAGKLDAEITIVFSNKDNAYGLERAKKASIPVVSFSPKSFKKRSNYDEALRDALQQSGVGLVVMAGYMIKLGKEVLDAFPNKVINLHPALLPSFKGAHGIKDAFDYGVKFTGVTVHFADSGYDTGPIIAQEVVPIEAEDTLETLEAKIHEKEYEILPAVIQQFAREKHARTS